MTIKDQLTDFLKGKDWIPKGDITDTKSWEYYEKGVKKTYLSETVGRALRELEEESVIAVKDDGSKSILYKFIPKEMRYAYIPFSHRIDKDKLFLKEGEEMPKKRTGKQNNALHKYCSLLAEELNNAGLDMKKVLKPEVDIPWETGTVKKYLWKPIQDAYLQKESTTELETGEVSKVYDIINRHIGEKFGIHLPFPSDEPDYEEESYLS